ncbi:hypothetical protein SAMCFNEI73_pB0437 (plasmid) [Sinorhizobium americanum]|uniref:Uncharacterized protein n=1 Tax=Sinorhizobium americanum TaxID=194963 RepID=A0A1L3LU97_9HYPH|nr:hypothetical protein SAMCCGM7_pB0404 [Sinorhizobium americanum CCGM7]APG93633.1 hypothetical protein SAMCFNEI73_pB0437 [Sinorhizobium americanum]
MVVSLRFHHHRSQFQRKHRIADYACNPPNYHQRYQHRDVRDLGLRLTR